MTPDQAHDLPFMIEFFGILFEILLLGILVLLIGIYRVVRGL